jgi:hypothetical protein
LCLFEQVANTLRTRLVVSQGQERGSVQQIDGHSLASSSLRSCSRRSVLPPLPCPRKAARTLINQGTIRADVSGRWLKAGDGARISSLSNARTLEASHGASLYEYATSFTNTGTVGSVGNGSILSLSNLQPNAGVIETSDSGLVSVSGNFNNLAEGTVRLGIGGTGMVSNGRLNVTKRNSAH